jgi:two-component sensor histidine kinase/PAS domain-containing protein
LTQCCPSNILGSLPAFAGTGAGNGYFSLGADGPWRNFVRLATVCALKLGVSVASLLPLCRVADCDCLVNRGCEAALAMEARALGEHLQKGGVMSDTTRAIVDTMAQPVLVLDTNLTVVFANRAFRNCFHATEAETVGTALVDLGNGQWDIPELRQLLADVSKRGDEVEGYRVEHDFETIGHRSMIINGRLLADQEGRVLLAISDVTEQERRENELIAAKEFAEKLIDSIREALLVLSRELRVESANASFYEMFKVSPEETVGKLVYEIGNGQWNIPELRSVLEDVLPKQRAFDDYLISHDFPSIGRRTMLLNGRELDHLPRLLLAIRDETERRRYAASQKIMASELQHRVKNILANVQSIARSTLSQSDSLEAFEKSFTARVQAMARAQDLLMRGPEGRVDLHELVSRELSAHGWDEDGALQMAGPAVELSRRETQTFAMVIHELATNAVKYGAFSRSSGHLRIVWEVKDGKGRRHLAFEWMEQGVPISSEPPRSGFGRGMIEQAVQYALHGVSELRFEKNGVRCTIRFPLEQD